VGTRTRRIFGQDTKPRVHIAGMDLPATAIREGNFERVDLTLLSVDEQKLPVYLRMRRMPLCDNYLSQRAT